MATCPPADIVFAMDTSGSMDDDAEALCAFIGGLGDELGERGLETFRLTALGLFETANFSDIGSPPGEAYSCLEDTVYRALGGDGLEPLVVPGDPPNDVIVGGQLFTPGLFRPDAFEANEHWGSATTLLAAEWTWLPRTDTVRVVVPMSDESPMTGSTLCDPVDEAVIENTIQVAKDHGVRVSPIIGQEFGRDVCIPTLAERLALETDGTFAFTETADELADAVTLIVEEACRSAL